MLFNSLEFWIFFAAVFGLYAALSFRAQNTLLLIASFVFYAWWDQDYPWWHLYHYRFALLMFATAAIDFYCGLRIADSDNQRSKRGWLLVSLISNLGVLAFFKYCNFFIQNAQAVFDALGIGVHPELLKITLPVAISFYTFQSIAYTVDVYRGELKPTRHLWDFLLFVCYFPHLVAGPINRPQGLLSQCERPRRMTWEGWREGAVLVLIGLFKKVAVADQLGPLADKVFADPSHCSTLTLFLGLYCYSIQIYADFSGYSDIARGLAKFMGFELMINFNQPYFSSGITDFWRRWHISLSSWLRDYLYIPLGGNRLGKLMTYRNLFLTMFLGGLWHGASWTFVAWGAMHGVYLAVHKWMLDRKPRVAEPSPDAWLVKALKVLATFHLVALTWIFFRAQTFTAAWAYVEGLAAMRGKVASGPISLDGGDLRAAGLAVLVLLLLVDLPQYLHKDHTRLLQWRLGWRVAACALLALWIIQTRTGQHVPFIYFQF